MTDLLKTWIESTMASAGNFGIALLMFLENIFPPIPSELIMPLAGFTANTKPESGLTLASVIVAGLFGTMLGTMPWYYLGVWLGEDRLRALADRYGKWVGMTGDDLDRANRWFYKHGNVAVFLGRLVPGLRTVISLPAGISRMPLMPFLLYSTLGSGIWITFLTGAGYVLGQNYELVDQYLAPVSKIVVVLLLIAAIVWIVRRWKDRSSDPS
jgi:membrane protein DedA with SNARE-associated domain